MQTPSLCQCRIAGTLEMCGLWLGCYFFKLILSFRKIDNLNFNVERWRRAVLKTHLQCGMFILPNSMSMSLQNDPLMLLASESQLAILYVSRSRPFLPI